MEIVDSMPNGKSNKAEWDKIAESLKQGAVLKFTTPADFAEDKAGSFRSTLYTRMGQRGVRIKSTIREDGVFVSIQN